MCIFSVYKKINKKISIIILLLFLFQIISSPFTNKAFAVDDKKKTIDNALKLEVVTDKENIDINDNAVTKVKYSFAATDSNGIDLKVLYKIPKNMEFVKVNKSTDIKNIENKKLNDGSELVTIYFKDEISPGVSGMFEVFSKFKGEEVDKKATGIQEATLSGFKNDGQEYTPATDMITYYTKTKSPDWKISKEKISPSNDPTLDSIVTYKIRIIGNSNGGPYINDAKITDKIPEGSEFVSASPKGSFKDGEVNWSIDSLKPGDNREFYVKVKYPSAKFKSTDTVTNNVKGTVTMYKENKETETKEAKATHGFGDPLKGASNIIKNTRRANDEYSLGQDVEYYLSGFSNNGNVELNKFIITDDIPKELDLRNVSTGIYNKDINLKILYSTNKNKDFVLWKEINNPKDEKLSVDDLRASGKLTSDEYITSVKWDFGNSVEEGFSLNNSNIYVGAKILDKDRLGKDIKSGDKITNTANLEWDEGKSSDDEVITIGDAKAWPEAKLSINMNEVSYEDDFMYSLKVKNNRFAKGNMIAPIVSFILPKEITLDKNNLNYSIDIGNSGYDEKTLKDNVKYDFKDVKINGEDRTILNWTFNDNIILYPNKEFNIKFNSKVKDTVRSGHFENKYYLSQKDTSKIENIKELEEDKNNLTGDTKRLLLPSKADLFVKFQGSIKADEWSLGELDTKWNRYKGSKEDKNIPTDQKGISETTQGGLVNYLVRIDTSDVNGPLSNLVLIDQLPYKNDVGVIDGQPRGSTWRPYMVSGISIGKEEQGKIELINDKNIKIYYTTSETPSKVDIVDPLKEDTSGDWSESIPEDITTVKGIKIDFGKYKIEPKTKLYIHWAMKAPLGAPNKEIAWNSFAFNAAVPAMNDKGLMGLLPSEPLKIGFKVNESKKGSIGNFVFEDMNANGVIDDEDLKKGINGLEVGLIGNRKTIDTGNSPFDEMVGNTRTGDNQDGLGGHYIFPELENGNYKVEFKIPKDYYVSEEGKDSDTNKNVAKVTETEKGDFKNLTTDNINISSNNFNKANIGIFKKASIKDVVFEDSNLNNNKEDNENGMEGVIVSLKDEKGNLVKDLLGNEVKDITTDKDGKYSFDNLKPGKYVINYSLPKKLDQFIFTDNLKNQNQKLEINLVSGQELNDLKVGIHEALIGGIVWEDWNFDGLREDSERPVKDVNVKLYQSVDGTNKNGKFISETKTDSNGKYLFTRLESGNYYVKIDKPSDFDKFTIINDSDKTRNSKVNKDGFTESFKIEVGSETRLNDAGLTVESKIGEYIYEDINGNDKKDNDEPFVDGAKINLFDGSGRDVTPKDVISDKDGKYEFDKLHEGGYYVSVSPTGQSGLSNQISNYIDLKRQDINHSVNIGLSKPVTVSGNVWNDKEWNKVKDKNDSGICNIEVLFYRNGDASPIKTVKTDKDGNFTADNLKPGQYIIKFIDKEGKYVPDDKDYINLKTISGDNIKDINLALHKGKIMDKVWYDINCDGKYDKGEEALSGVTVKLLDKDLKIIKETKTGSNGDFYFDDLDPKEYIVSVSKPEGFDSFLKGSKFKEDGNTEIFTLNRGEEKNDIPCPLVAKSDIGDFIFEDLNGNGIKDSNENGIEGVLVKLLDKDKKEIDKIKTDKDGMYIFKDLTEGEYFIKVEKPESYKWFSPKNKDSKADEEGLTEKINLLKDKSDLSLDAGLVKESTIKGNVFNDLAWNKSKDKEDKDIFNIKVELYIKDKLITSINTDKDGNYEFKDLKPEEYTVKFIDESKSYIPTEDKSDVVNIVLNSGDKKDVNLPLHKGKIIDKVWYDINCNGKYDEGEEALKGVTVKLLDKDLKPIKETKTESNGGFYFDDLDPKDYKINISIPKEFDGVTSGCAYDDKGNAEFSLKRGECKEDLNAPLRAKSDIGDFIFEDLNGNGIKDSNEKGIEGVLVKLLDKDKKEVEKTKTDKDGMYIFKDLTEGEYFIKVEKPENYKWFSPKDKDSKADEEGLTEKINLLKDKSDLSLDAGLVKESTIKGNVFNDLAWNKAKDKEDKDIENIKVELYIKDKLITSINTDKNGNYEFKDLKPEEYTVKFIDETKNYILTEEKSDVVNLVLNSGDKKDINLALHKGKIIDKVWYDINCDGKYDKGEEVLSGVTVKLLDKDLKLIKETKTGSNGDFYFDDLDPKEYIVSVSKPEGFDSFLKGSKFKEDGNTEIFTLNRGEEKNDIPCPLVAKSDIGDFIFEDLNGNGIKDSNENGIEGVLVKLLDKDKKELDKIKTDKDGMYIFKDLTEGEYFIKVEKPEIYKWFSPKNKDSKVNEEGLTEKINLLKDKSDLSLDAGLIKEAKISEVLYSDENFNLKRDPEEKGLENVKISLFKKEDDKDIKIGDVKTDNEGRYTFNSLKPGQYFIKIDNPKNTVFTQKNDIINLSSGETLKNSPNSLKEFKELEMNVFEDKNLNGKKDVGEKNIKNATITLKDKDGNRAKDIYGNYIEDKMTDENGNVYFEYLPKDVFMVNTKYPEEYSSLNNKESFVDLSGTEDNSKAISNGAVKLSSIIGKVNDNAKEGTTVELLDKNNNLISKTKTDKDGKYHFDGLVPNDYYIVVNGDKDNKQKVHLGFGVKAEVKDKNILVKENKKESKALENIKVIPKTGMDYSLNIIIGLIILSAGIILFKKKKK